MPTAQDFLAALSEATGVPLAFREDLTCCLLTPQGFEIQIEHAPEQSAIVFVAALGSVQPGDEALLRHLLEANFLFQGTRGESVGLEASTGRARRAYRGGGGKLHQVLAPAAGGVRKAAE